MNGGVFSGKIIELVEFACPCELGTKKMGDSSIIIYCVIFTIVIMSQITIVIAIVIIS